MINKRNIIIFVFFSFVLSQNSLLSLYGFGEHINSYDASSIGLGDSKFFSLNYNGLALSSPSSLSKNNLSFLSMTTNFSEIEIKETGKLNSNIFHFLSYAFPVSNRTYFSISLNPLFRTNMYVEENEYNIYGADESPIDTDYDGINDPVAYKNNYDFMGGVSEFNISISNKISKDVYFGFKIGRLFGTSKRDYDLNFYSIAFNQDGSFNNFNLFSSQNIQDVHKYSSINYNFDLRFSISSLEYDNEFVIMYGESDQMKVEINSDLSDINQIYYSTDVMSENGFGFKINRDENSGFIFEYHGFESFDSPANVNLFSNNYPDMSSYHFGIFNKIINDKKGFWNEGTVGAGLYFKNYILNSNKIKDYGLTLGMGIKYLENNTFNLGFKFGKRKSDFYDIHDEKYFKLYITLISTEKWLIK